VQATGAACVAAIVLPRLLHFVAAIAATFPFWVLLHTAALTLQMPCSRRCCSLLLLHFSIP
jgi:hypothetical protein